MSGVCRCLCLCLSLCVTDVVNLCVSLGVSISIPGGCSELRPVKSGRGSFVKGVRL